MAISLVGTGSGNAINGGNVTATFSVGGIAGDVVYVAVTTRATLPATISTAGYSQIATSASGSIALTIWRKVLTASESSVAVTGNADTGSVTAVSAFVVRGVDNYVPEDIISAAATGTTGSPNPPTVTTVTRGTRALVFAGSQINDAAVTAPTGYGDLAGSSNTDTIPSSCHGAFRSTDITNRATAEDPAAFTNWNSGNWASFTIILRQSIATAYWVSGTGSWTTTNAANWASTSGGTAGHIPNADTDVIFDASSDQAAANFVVTVGAGVSCKSFSTSALESTMTLAGSGAWSIYGSLNFPASNFTRTYTGALTFKSVGTGHTITSNGISFASAITFDGSGTSEWTFQDAFTTTSTITLTTGEILLGTYTVTCLTFASTGANTRAIDFGTGKIVITSTAATTIWNTPATDDSLKIYGIPLVETTGGVSNLKTITANASEIYTISFSLLNTAGSITITASSSIRNLTISNNSFTLNSTLFYIYGNLLIQGTTPTVASGTAVLYFSKSSGTQTITTNGKNIDRPITKDGAGTLQLQDALSIGVATSRTFTLTAGTLDVNSYNMTIYGIFSSSNSTTRRIQNTGGTGKIILSLSPAASTTLWLLTTTTNMTTDSNVIVQLTGSGAGNKLIDSGTLSETNAISFQISCGVAIGSTVAFTNSNTLKNITFDDTGYDFTNRALTIYGNLVSTITANTRIITGSNAWTFASTSGTKTISNGTESLQFPIIFDGVGGAWQLLTNVTISNNITLTNGTIDLNSLILTSTSFSVTGTGTKVLAHGTGGKLTIYAGNFNNTGSNLSYTGTGTIDMTSPLAKTFAGNGGSYATLNQGGAGDLTITGSNTFLNITNTVQPATVLFTAGTTQTFTSNFQLTGTSGNLITIGSVTPTSTFTLSKTSGTVSVSFCSISDSIAAGGAIWEAYTTNGNVDGGNNTGWIFAIASAVAGAFLMFFY